MIRNVDKIKSVIAIQAYPEKAPSKVSLISFFTSLSPGEKSCDNFV
jgi:hypothetical protein